MPEISMRYGQLECGFFRYLGGIYFAMPRGIYLAMPHGKMIFHFPVKDGKICRRSDGSNIYPGESISAIPLRDMANHGMQINQGDNPLDQRFWS